LKTSAVENTRKLFPRAPLDQVIVENLLPEILVEGQLTGALVHQVEEDAVQGQDKLQAEILD